MPKLFSDPEAIAEDIIRDVGTNLMVGLPLGLGKANPSSTRCTRAPWPTAPST
jgi:hypothetical protein